MKKNAHKGGRSGACAVEKHHVPTHVRESREQRKRGENNSMQITAERLQKESGKGIEKFSKVLGGIIGG